MFLLGYEIFMFQGQNFSFYVSNGILYFQSSDKFFQSVNFVTTLQIQNFATVSKCKISSPQQKFKNRFRKRKNSLPKTKKSYPKMKNSPKTNSNNFFKNLKFDPQTKNPKFDSKPPPKTTKKSLLKINLNKISFLKTFVLKILF